MREVGPWPNREHGDTGIEQHGTDTLGCNRMERAFERGARNHRAGLESRQQDLEGFGTLASCERIGCRPAELSPAFMDEHERRADHAFSVEPREPAHRRRDRRMFALRHRREQGVAVGVERRHTVEDRGGEQLGRRNASRRTLDCHDRPVLPHLAMVPGSRAVSSRRVARS